MIEEEFIELVSAPNALLKTKRVEVRSEPHYLKPYAPAVKWAHNSMTEEMYNWRRMFIGRSELEFKHCVLTIAIRREHDLQENLRAYFLTWTEEADFLVKALSVKWLVSACDTFADYADDDADRATALIGATLIKTIKLYETERRFRSSPLKPEEWPEYQGTHLFDDMKSFNIGFGDVVINLKRRLKNLTRRSTPAALILDELFERACKFDTVFARWRAEHFHDPTRW